MSSPRPMRYGPRSQAFSPCRGSDPGSPHRPRHRREPCASRARSRNSQMSRITKPSSAGAVANRSIAASASATSASRARSSSVSTRTPVAGMPHESSCPSRISWSTAANMSGIASSRSPRRALSPARYTLMSRNSLRLCPRRWNMSLTSASSFCPRSRSASGWRCTSARPSIARATTNARSSPDRSAIRSASSISRTAGSWAARAPSGIPGK